MEKITLWILVMSAITFISRYAFFAKTMPIKLNRHSKQFLMFTGPCVLTAMWAPIAFADALAQVNLFNPYLLAAIFTIVISLLIRQTMVVIVLSMACFYFLRWMF